MGFRPRMPSKAAPIEVFSDDPEVMALQAMIRGMRHFNAKKLAMRHMRILAAVNVCVKVTKKPATIEGIEAFSGLRHADFKTELNELVAHRYLHETHTTYGALKDVYSVGPLGGTALRQMFKSAGKKAAANGNETNG